MGKKLVTWRNFARRLAEDGDPNCSCGAAEYAKRGIARSQLTTEQVIAKVGCTKKSLANWKKGIRPRDYYIGRLSAVLGTDLWPLYERHTNTNIKKEALAELSAASPSPLSNSPNSRTSVLSVLTGVGHQRIDGAMKQYAQEQLDHLWDQFHTMEEAIGTETLRLAAQSYNQMLAAFSQWPLADTERRWLLQAMADGAILTGRLARDQINYQEAIWHHKQALHFALDSHSSDHVAAATMRLAETFWEAGLIHEAIAYCKAGIEYSRTANPRIRGEFLGYAAEAYSSIGDLHESERLVNEAARLAVGAVRLPTAGGINFSETAAAEYLANEAVRRGEIGAALSHIQRARRLLATEFPTSHNVRWEAHLFLDQARAHNAANDLEAAFDDVYRAARLAEQISSPITMRKAHSILQELARQQKSPTVMTNLSDELLRRLMYGK